MVWCLFPFVREICCSRELEFWACPTMLEHLDCRMFRYARMVCTVKHFDQAVGILSLSTCFWSIRWFCKARMVCTVCLLSWWKILAQGSWNFELVQLFLDSWIADCFVRRA
jgi:hypothetical protein